MQILKIKIKKKFNPQKKKLSSKKQKKILQFKLSKKKKLY